MKMFSAPKIPEPKPPAPMPDIDSAEVAKAKQAKLLSMAQRTGRVSTLLSESTDKLGG